MIPGRKQSQVRQRGGSLVLGEQRERYKDPDRKQHPGDYTRETLSQNH